MAGNYKSSIPQTARERVVEKYPSGKKRRAEYRLQGMVVGVRCFYETGEFESETPLKSGKRHGTAYYWYEPGCLDFAEPFVDGVAHGTAKQWSRDGKLMGTYKMKHGTGLDLWWCENEDGSVVLSEVHYLKNGFQWFINEDQKRIDSESHYNGKGLHGICRRWNAQNRLCRGYPQYYVNHKKVTKRQYMSACRDDLTLPPFRVEDNAPSRVFPPEIAKHLRPSASRN